MLYRLDCCTRDELTGWALGEREPADVRIFINNRPVNVSLARVLRPDLAQAFPQYPHSAKSGFSILLPESPLNPKSPIANVRIHLTARQESEDLFVSLPSQILGNLSWHAYWKAKSSPFPPAAMADIEMAF